MNRPRTRMQGVSKREERTMDGGKDSVQTCTAAEEKKQGTSLPSTGEGRLEKGRKQLFAIGSPRPLSVAWLGCDPFYLAHRRAKCRHAWTYALLVAVHRVAL